ncbi:chemotaxis protein CheA [Spirochaeta cellobiosiphila]|uniref:chemotaxis protein CheA n=1 Tax=Spirochaeta cellobiosiphila TaxID=504483 RepID=UPI00041D61CE|nr:chemotaxis protein CheA [Spirochaeta cellobiosiphila]
MDKFKEAFKEEAIELLGTLEDDLLKLEQDPQDKDTLFAVFRVMHTIKGSSSMFGFEKISHFTHQVETVMEELRNGEIPVTEKLIDLTLRCRDQIYAMLDEDTPELDKSAQELIVVITNLVEQRSENPDEAPEVKEDGDPVVEAVKTEEEKLPEEPETELTIKEPEKEEVQEEDPVNKDVTYRIKFHPSPEFFLTGSRPLLILQELQELGEYSCRTIHKEVPSFDNLKPENNYLAWDILVTTNKGRTLVDDAFIFLDAASELEITEVHCELIPGTEPRIGEILVKNGVVEAETVNEALKGQKKIGEVLKDHQKVSEEDLNTALSEQEHIKKVIEKKKPASNSSLRVSSDKLDKLVDLVGELVTVQARIAQIADHERNTSFASVSEELERLTTELRDNAMILRMVPIGSTFTRFNRLVRDLAQDLDKAVLMNTEGGDTELDKTIIEKLNDPLVHIIRNSIDHGIETPQEREAKGKNPQGTVCLKAVHQGASVSIIIEDDGNGLDKDRILNKAIERGLVNDGNGLSDEDIFRFIFEPGFSTAKVVSSVSGRGVGMDVVKRQIEALRGKIKIESVYNQFTRITLSFPLTLAIIEGLLVRIGSEYMVIPLSSVIACVDLTKEEVESQKNRRYILFRDEILPYIHLKKLFEFESDNRDIEQVVVIKSTQDLVGFVVDEVIGDYQTVIKTLGPLYQDLEGISGATILGNGRVALIVDVEKISEIARHNSKEHQKV